MPHSIEGLKRILQAYDLVDLAAGVGALQVMPENSERQIRLDRAAALIASLPYTKERPKIAASNFRKLINDPPITDESVRMMEDPAESLFTESVTFFDGPAVVFPGIDSNLAEIIRCFLEAVFLLQEDELPSDYVAEMRETASAILKLSDTIAERAKLTRNMRPASSKAVEVPFADRFAKLKEAVTFTQDNLQSLLHPVEPAVLEPLSIVPGIFDLSTQVPEQLYATPILKVDDHYIVILPSGLLVALRDRFIQSAQLAGCTEVLARLYRSAVSHRVDKSLRQMMWRPWSHTLRSVQETYPWAENRFWSLDTDKVAHVVVITDDLEGYGSEELFGHWSPEYLRNLGQLLEVVRQQLQSSHPDIRGILQLVVFQGVGRSFAFGPSKTPETGDTEAYLLMSSQADLTVMARMESLDLIGLWKYAKSRSKFLKKTKVLSFGALDEYSIYNSCGKSFYLNDKENPDMLAVDPGTSANIRFEDAKRFDFHGVRMWGQAAFLDVQRRYPGSEIPIYVPPPTSSQVAFLVEGLPIPIWIRERTGEQRERDFFAFHVCEATAYWVWQASPSIKSLLEETREYIDCLEIQVSLEGNWSNPQSLSGDWCNVVVRCPNQIQLELHPTDAFLRADNAGERHLLGKLLAAFCELAARLSTSRVELDIEKSVEKQAPLGLKKKLLVWNANQNLRLYPAPFPPPRFAHGADFAALLDEMGNWLADNLNLEVGPIHDEQRTQILNKIVEFYMVRLESIIAQLSPEGLLEFLVLQNEVLVLEDAQIDLRFPARLASFGEDSKYIADLQERMSDRMNADQASRFLIEYAAACPSSGDRKVSWQTYDYLLALSAEIISKGSLSDAIRYSQADVQLSLLPSGRLGIHREGQYMEGTENFRSVHADTSLSNIQGHLAKHWQDRPSQDLSRIPKEIEEATNAEFGFVLSEMIELANEIIDIGLGLETEPKIAPLEHVLQTLEAALGWSVNRIKECIALFALEPRTSFLPEENPFTVYPWRFNRELSYTRRPLLIRRVGSKEDLIWGIRHVDRAISNFVQLIAFGRLKAESVEMVRLMSTLKSEEAEAFNDQVAEFFRDDDRLLVHARVKKVGSTKIERKPGEELGDIDVLVVHPEQRRVLAIEVKDLEVAKTPFELSNELDKLFLGEDSAVARHMERLKWLEDNIPMLCKWLGLNPTGKWYVEGLIVTDQTHHGSYVQDSPLEVTSFRELQQTKARHLLKLKKES